MGSALDAAAYLEQEKSVSAEVQLQKLLYYSQAWSLVWTGKPLFPDEIEAWTGGPVVRSVWAAGGSLRHRVIRQLNESQRSIIDAVFAFYGHIPGARLSDMTHAELPWKEARGDLPVDAQSAHPVSQATMRRFYTRVAVQHPDVAPTRPFIDEIASDELVTQAVERQRDRWRHTLDQLADR